MPITDDCALQAEGRLRGHMIKTLLTPQIGVQSDVCKSRCCPPEGALLHNMGAKIIQQTDVTKEIH